MERAHDVSGLVRKKIADNVVLASHNRFHPNSMKTNWSRQQHFSLISRLRHNFLFTEVQTLAAECEMLIKKYSLTKSTLEREKSEEGRLKTERSNMETQAGLLGNMAMLRDYQSTVDSLQREVNRNDLMKRRLGCWWEGFKKTGENIWVWEDIFISKAPELMKYIRETDVCLFWDLLYNFFFFYQKVHVVHYLREGFKNSFSVN